MEHSKLKDHKFKNGLFTTPFNEFVKEIGQENSWFYGRLPEYIWIGFILDYYGRDTGLDKCYQIIQRLHQIDANIVSLKISRIFDMTVENQNAFFSFLSKLIDREVLSPLSVIFTYSTHREFVRFFKPGFETIEQRLDSIQNLMNKTSDHQSHLSADIRFVVLAFQSQIGKLKLTKEMADELGKYPYISHDSEEMRFIRPSIRAAEMCLLLLEDDQLHTKYLKNFWEVLSEMSECKLYYYPFPSESDDKEKYMLGIQDSMQYYTDQFLTSKPLDTKMLVLLGIATYSFKRFRELVEHDLCNTISGRSIIRVIIEDYIMMKYLIKKENSNPNIWTEYQYYGIGQYKLVSERHIELGIENADSHVPYAYIDGLVNEYKDKEFINMDTSYFGTQSIREKAIEVDEKNLFGLYYDYDSAFEHGLWGAIRESSMLKCTNPAHQYHCVPDIFNEQNLKSVWFDSCQVMTKIIGILETTYGKTELPESSEKES